MVDKMGKIYLKYLNEENSFEENIDCRSFGFGGGFVDFVPT